MNAAFPDYCPICQIGIPETEKLRLTSAGGTGVAVLPGQSPDEVLLLASIIDREADIGEYFARRIARKVLAALASSRRECSDSRAP